MLHGEKIPWIFRCPATEIGERQVIFHIWPANSFAVLRLLFHPFFAKERWRSFVRMYHGWRGAVLTTSGRTDIIGAIGEYLLGEA